MKMRMKSIIKILAVTSLAGLLFAPRTVWGQGQTWVGGNLQQMIEAARWRLGVFRINAAFRLSNAGYDSDIFYGYLDEPVPDGTASASTPIQVLLPLSKKAVIDVSESPEYVFYYDNRDQRAWNNRLNGRVHIALNKAYLQAGGGMSDVRRRLSPELDLNIRQKTNSVSSFALWQTSKSTSLALLYGGAKYDYDDEIFIDGASIADRLDRNEEFLDLIAYIQPSPRVRLSFDGQYGSYQFRRSFSNYRDSTSYGFFVGAEFVPGERDIEIVRGIKGTASIGYIRLDVRDPLLQDGAGLVGEAGVQAYLSRRMTGQLTFSRGFRFSVYSGASFYLATTVGAGLTRHLSRKADLTYDFTYGTTSYSDFDSGGPAPYYRYLTHRLSLNLRLARHVGVTFYGSFGQRDGGGSSPLRNKYFAGISLLYGFTGSGMSAPTRGGTL